MKRIFILTLFALLFLLVLPSEALAQGVFQCTLQGTSCVVLQGSGSGCQTGYVVGTNCATMNTTNPSSAVYCGKIAPPCAPSLAFGGEGEQCRQGGVVCDSGLTCNTNGTCRSTAANPPGGGPGGGGSNGGVVTGSINGGCGSFGQSIDTAIGCIDISDSNTLIGFFLRWAMGIAGGIAVLMIIFAGFKITTSSGDPKRLQAGQELLTSAIAGVILLVFSIFILQVVGVNILGLNLAQ